MSENEIKVTNLRLPADLNEKIKSLAAQSGLSFNAFVVQILRNWESLSLEKRVELLEKKVAELEKKLSSK